MKTKQSLYDFIDMKIQAKRKELNQQIEDIITEEIGDHLDTWLIGIDQLEGMAQRFAYRYGEALREYGVDSWNRKNLETDINRYGTTISKGVRERVIGIIRNTIEGCTREEIGYIPLDEAQDRAAIRAVPVHSQLVKLDKLKKELHNAIRNERSGERGYKALVALGVDMDGYEKQSRNLPAVVKLSVDPCLINGGC